MAKLTLEVGQLTATVTATDASAAKVLANYAAAYGLDTVPVEYDADGNPLPAKQLTQQEILQAVADHLASHINVVSVGHQRRLKREQADEEVELAKEELNND